MEDVCLRWGKPGGERSHDHKPTACDRALRPVTHCRAGKKVLDGVARGRPNCGTARCQRPNRNIPRAGPPPTGHSMKHGPFGPSPHALATLLRAYCDSVAGKDSAALNSCHGSRRSPVCRDRRRAAITGTACGVLAIGGMFSGDGVEPGCRQLPLFGRTGWRRTCPRALHQGFEK